MQPKQPIDLSSIPDGPEKEELIRQLNKEKAAEERRLREEADKKAQDAYDRRVRAVIETALAYYRRGEAQQYESMDMNNATTDPGDIGVRRATNHVSPEDATAETPTYLVCSTFAYNVYYDAMGFKLCGTDRACKCRQQMALGDKSIVYHWMRNCGETLDEAVETVRSLLRPGDILTSVQKSGHCMVYLGDCFGDGTNYICHSWGAKYNKQTCKESHEDMGTIRLQPVEQLCFHQGDNQWYKENKIPRWNLHSPAHQEIIILRPLRIATDDNYPLTPNAVARLARPGLNITRTASPGAYRTAAKGDVITYTLVIENHSQNDYACLPVLEKLPLGVTLADAGGAAVTDNGLRWAPDVNAGSSVTLTYSVRANADAPGKIISEGGNVAGIRSNRIVTLVGANLTEEDAQKLAALADAPILPGKTLEGLAFPCYIYEACLGRKLDLPDAKTLVAALMEETTGQGATGPLVRRKKTCAYPDAEKMLLDRYHGGVMLVTDRAEDRILEFDNRYLQPGDILLYVKSPLTQAQTEKVYLYLGNGAYGYMAENGMAVTREDVLWPAFVEDVFFCLRPSLLDT